MINQNLPRLFIAGASAYPREIDFKRLREIINNANKNILDRLIEEGYVLDKLDKEFEKRKIYFMVDMAHIAGLVAAGLHQSPLPYADVVTSTVHKTLRGTRGGLILTNSDDLIKKINKAVFPAVQGGPLEHIIAAKAVTFGEALKPEFKEYMKNVVNNTKTLAEVLNNNGVKLLTNGTDNHLVLLDLRDRKITGKELEDRLAQVNIITNKNAVPFDTQNKNITSGLRIGTAAITARGLQEEDIKIVANIISTLIKVDDDKIEEAIDTCKDEVAEICKKYPLYQD